MRNAWLTLTACTIWLGCAMALSPTPAGAYNTCSPKFPHGVRGTLHTAVTVGFEYKTEGDLEINAQRETEWLQSSLSDQASATPVGLQFDYTGTGRRIDLHVIVLLNARGKDSTGHAQAYWADVRVYGMGQNGTDLFYVTTHAYEPDSLSDVFTEASTTIYTYLANGWSCKR